MNYEILRKNTNLGWNTWNTRNVLSYSHLPEGFTINLCIKDFSCNYVLRESLVGRNGETEEKIFPGARTYDGSLTQLNLKFRELEIDVKTAVKDDEQYIIVSPLKHGRRVPVLIIEACLLWGKDGNITKNGNKIFGECNGRRFEIFTTGTLTDIKYTASLSPYIAVLLDKPLVISTKSCTLDEATEIFKAEKVKLDAKNNSYGKHSESYTAMKTCLAWDTIYDPEHDRICSPVSRIWNVGWGGYVLFDWDTYFASIMASVENKELAQLNAIAITNEVTEKGFIPNFGSVFDLKSRDRSQPPVGSFACLEIYKRWPEKWFLQQVYPALLKWNRFFSDYRTTKEGYLCWGSDPYEPLSNRPEEINCIGDWLGAALESGLDNSPMYDNTSFDEKTNMMMLADVGLMGLYIMDCRSLIEMSRILGEDEIISELEARKERTEKALATLWDEDFGMFLNKDLTNGSFSKRISPTNFYALHSDLVTEAQKRRIMDEHFYNPEEFWGDYVLPSIARNDPAFPDQEYWRGCIWAPMNYLAYTAIKHAGLKKECDDLAAKSEELLLKEWRSQGHVHENYNAYDGMGCNLKRSDKFYHWGGLLAYIALDNEENK
ncbi:MAG: hypothetical protein J6M16_11000 [Clostridia bacterium]|nr:hypothetical protein [Clostridia bacterium]